MANGKLIGKDITPTAETRPNGVWNLVDQYVYNRRDVWPPTSPIIGYAIDTGTRDTTNYPTTYSINMDFTANESCLFVVNRARATGTAAASSLTVNGVSCSLVGSLAYTTSNIIEVYHVGSVPAGTQNVVSVGDGAGSVAITAFMLGTSLQPTTNLSVFSSSYVSGTGNQLLTVPVNTYEFVYMVSPSLNEFNMTTAYTLPNDSFPAFGQAYSGSFLTNVGHWCSGVAENSTNVSFYVDATAGATEQGAYIIFTLQ